jgi:hypothetical protein
VAGADSDAARSRTCSAVAGGQFNQLADLAAYVDRGILVSSIDAF